MASKRVTEISASRPTSPFERASGTRDAPQRPSGALVFPSPFSSPHVGDGGAVAAAAAPARCALSQCCRKGEFLFSSLLFPPSPSSLTPSAAVGKTRGPPIVDEGTTNFASKPFPLLSNGFPEIEFFEFNARVRGGGGIITIKMLEIIEKKISEISRDNEFEFDFSPLDQRVNEELSSLFLSFSLRN